jgi:hypothetical protein
MRRLMPAAVLMAAVLVTAFPATALAHEERQVGSLMMAVGFGNEPAYAGEPNSVQLILSSHGKPVTDLGDALEVEVTFGGESKKLSLEPDFEIGEFGTPGDYRAWFVPTQPGTYTFHFTGKVGGQKVDEAFTSGKGFVDVTPISDAEFPATRAPTNEELAQRLDRVVPRLEHAIGEVRAPANATDPLVIVAIVVGILGIVVGAAAIAMGRRRGTGA